MRIDSSQDILFLTLTVAVVVLTFFFAWLLYYLVSIIRQAHHVMQDVAESFERLHGILDSIKETINQSSSHLALIVGAVRQLTSFASKRRQKKSDDKAASDKRGKS